MSFGGSFSGPTGSHASRLNSSSYARDSVSTGTGTGAGAAAGGVMVEMAAQRPSGSVSVVNPLQRKDTYNSSAASSRTTSSATGVLQPIKR